MKMLCSKNILLEVPLRAGTQQQVISTEAPVSSVKDRNGGEVEKSIFPARRAAD